MKVSIGAAAIILTLAIAGCKEHDAPEKTASAEVAKIETANDVANALKAAGLPIVDVVTVTEESDSNHLLGRPGQYSSKVMFFDSRHPKSDDGSDTGENTIEVFANAADAKARHDYIDSVTKSMPMLVQYQVLQGRVLLRLDKVVLPSEAKAYETALAKVVPG